MCKLCVLILHALDSSTMGHVIENNDFEDIRLPAGVSDTIDLCQWFHPTAQNSVLLILNQRIELEKPVFERLWQQYTIRVCADGGANRLHDYLGEDVAYLPDLVVGDMDSIRPAVLQYYARSPKTTVIKQETQYSTDFMKSINAATLLLCGVDLSAQRIDLYDGISRLYGQADKTGLRDVPLLVLNGIDGRFDQTVHSMVQFYRLLAEDPYYKMCYLTLSDMIIAVPETESATDSRRGGHWLEIGELAPFVGNCGLLPFAGPTVIHKTRGLKWDVEDWETGIASGQTSTSNRFVGLNCYISCDKTIVLSIELKWAGLSSYI